MGVPKQKWTPEEEAALKAGVAKYGPGKWSTILKDPEFVPILHLRSNVDLKDKWRNMNLMASGCGSRHRARFSKLKSEPVLMIENTASARKENDDMETSIRDPPTVLARPLQTGSSKMPIPRLDALILETISTLKSPHDSSRAAIVEHIKENYSTPSNLEKLLKAELKVLMDCGKVIEVNSQYRMAPSSSNSGSKTNPSPLLLKVKQEYSHSLMADTSTIKILTKAEIDAELEKMKSMSPQEAAAMAVKAVAEAEAAISEAERAAREAEAAEADAELAQVFAAAAMKSLKQTALCT